MDHLLHLPHSQAPALCLVACSEAVGYSSCRPHGLRCCKKRRLICADLVSRLLDADHYVDDYLRMECLLPLPSEFERRHQLQKKQGGWSNSKVAA